MQKLRFMKFTGYVPGNATPQSIDVVPNFVLDEEEELRLPHTLLNNGDLHRRKDGELFQVVRRVVDEHEDTVTLNPARIPKPTEGEVQAAQAKHRQLLDANRKRIIQPGTRVRH